MGLWTSDANQKFDGDIADGVYDDQLDEMIKGFKLVGRPVWLRIGYEFNGPWNGHEPEGFKAAWIHITKKLRSDPWCNKFVANVWDFTGDAPDPLEKMENVWKYYPGDEWVDWAGANLF